MQILEHVHQKKSTPVIRGKNDDDKKKWMMIKQRVKESHTCVKRYGKNETFFQDLFPVTLQTQLRTVPVQSKILT